MQTKVMFMGLFSKKREPRPSFFVRAKELEKMRTSPRGTQGAIQIGDRLFHYHDAESFAVTYQELMVNEIYRFKATSSHPLIIDCGANMGLSVLYFAQLYPQAHIVAFEPEEPIFNLLQKNVQAFAAAGKVELHQKAVWDTVTSLQFFTDHGMGGSVANKVNDQAPTEVQTVRLAGFLQQPVDFLKVDIEGAEYTVLKDCDPYLKNVQHIFVEYHSYLNKEQKLEEVIGLLKKNGFRYHLTQSYSRQRPFVDRIGSTETMDMAINIFGYR